MSKNDVQERVLTALASLPIGTEFTATAIPEIVMHHERPDILALEKPLGQDRDFLWLKACKAWQAEQRGFSDTNMRLLANALVRQGTLSRRNAGSGWYVQYFYRLIPSALATAEAGA